MLGEDIDIRSDYLEVADQLIEWMYSQEGFLCSRRVIGISGESGSGKSVTAICLARQMEALGIKASVLHQDAYFKYSPIENSERRKADLSWVGPQEVDLQSMQDAIDLFHAGARHLNVRYVDYNANAFTQRGIDIADVHIMLVEGTYTLLLERMDIGIFIQRTYRDTIDVRQARRREAYDPFVEKVLQVEHNIISALEERAQILIRKDYSLQFPDGQAAIRESV